VSDSHKRGRCRRPAPLSIRLSDAEKTALRQKAAGVPLGTFIKRVVFSGEAGVKVVQRGRYPVKDTAALGQVLGLLGKARLANNLNQLAKAANLGALPVTQETEADLRAACADVAAMRRLLLNALGVVRDELKSDTPSMSALFARSAGGRPS
jgi:hypothetical protein